MKELEHKIAKFHKDSRDAAQRVSKEEMGRKEASEGGWEERKGRREEWTDGLENEAVGSDTNYVSARAHKNG